MKGKQKRRRKIKGKERTRRRSAETRETELAMISSVAKEATTASAGNNRACSDGGYRKNKCGGSKGIGNRGRTEYGSSSKKGSIHNGNKSEEELLCMQRIWAHGPSLQKSRSERKGSRK